MEGRESELLEGRQWTLTVFANPQILSLLGQGWTYREILRVNTLSSRRVHVENLSPRDTVLTLKQRLEDIEGVPVSDQELRRVNLDGATELIMRDEQLCGGASRCAAPASAARTACGRTQAPGDSTRSLRYLQCR